MTDTSDMDRKEPAVPPLLGQPATPDQGDALDRGVTRAYSWRRQPPPEPDELRVEADDQGFQVVLDRLADSGSHADRRTTAVITGAGFASTLSGAPIIASVGNRALFLPALVLSVGAALSGIRAMTRRVEGRAGLRANWADIVHARQQLLHKRAWGWLGARLLRWAIYWLAGLTALLSFVH
jgi:hypothetical protein